MPATSFTRYVHDHYVVADLASVFLYNSAASRLEALVLDGTFIALGATDMSGNDETALDIDGAQQKQHSSCTSSRRRAPKRQTGNYEHTIGKIMALYKRWSFVVRRKDKDERFQCISMAPHRLLALDRNTGETTFECHRRVNDLYIVFQRLLKRFPSHKVFNNDRAGQNDRAYRQTVAVEQEGGACLRLACDCHDVQTAQSAQFDAVPLLISNVLHVGLQHKQTGALDCLRKCLRPCFRARVRKVVGLRPPGPASDCSIRRKAILDVFLLTAQSTPATRKRAVVLERMCNGPWDSRRIHHFCLPGCCEDVDTMQVFENDVVEALVPSQRPKLERAKWLQASPAISWCGLLANCHCLFEDVMPIVCECLSKPDFELSEELFVLDEEDRVPGLDEDSDDDLPLVALGPASAEEDDTFVGDEGMPRLPDGSPNWSLFNSRVRSRVTLFASSRPASPVALMLRCMQPLRNIHKLTIWMGGENYNLNNVRLAQAGLPCRMQIVDCAKGEVSRQFWIETDSLFFGGAWEFLQPQDRTRKNKCLAFKLAAKGAGGISFLLDFRHARFPTLAFKTLDASESEIQSVARVAADSCTCDPFMERHMQIVAGDLHSEKSQSLLGSTASVAESTINFIEYGHAPARKLARVCEHARKRKFEVLCQDVGLRNLRLSDQGMFAPPDIKYSCRLFRQRQQARQRDPKALSMKPRQIRRRSQREAQGLPFGRKYVFNSWNVHKSLATRGMPGKAIGKSGRYGYDALSVAEKERLRRLAKIWTTQARAKAAYRQSHSAVGSSQFCEDIKEDDEPISRGPGKRESMRLATARSSDNKQSVSDIGNALVRAVTSDSKQARLQKEVARSSARTWMAKNGVAVNHGLFGTQRFPGHCETSSIQLPVPKVVAYIHKRLSVKQREDLVAAHSAHTL